MTTSPTMQSRLKRNRPSLRARARPPKLRTPAGEAFSAANLPVGLALQYCGDCDAFQYPPRELCQYCLGASWVWREAPGGGRLNAAVGLQHSLWEFFKRRLVPAGQWPVASVQLDCGPVVFAHLNLQGLEHTDCSKLAAGTPLCVFSHSDCAGRSVLIAVAADTPVATAAQRRELAGELGLLEPALREGGI